MNVALPTLPAAVLATSGADKQDGLLPVSATNLGMPPGEGLNLPLFIDVLAQVLPPLMLTQAGIPVPQDTVTQDEVVQSTLPVGQTPERYSAPVEGGDLAALPASWEPGAWTSILGVALQAGWHEQYTDADIKERSADEVVIKADELPAQVGAVPWLAASLQSPSSGLTSIVASPSSDGDVAAEGCGLAPQGVSPSVQGRPRSDTPPSMAFPVVRLPETAAEVAATPAEGSSLPEPPLPVSENTGALQLTEEVHAQPVTQKTLVMSDRTAALIQSAATLQQAGDADQPLALNPRQPGLWQRPLAQALGERLQVQGAQGEEQALIRLDPPSLGRVEIVLRQEGGTWQVQLSATHPEVSRQLQAISETLRHELSVRQQASVTVQVTSDHLGHADGRQQRQRQDGQQPREPGRAWDDDGAAQIFDLA
jgi:flagellar hook-length control protein FliK